MLVAQEKRKTNIAEYILYMWQVEDLLRACFFDPEAIESKLVSRFKADEKTSREISSWYQNLSQMMVNEHLQESGHLQVMVNLVNDLNEFHLKLIETQKDENYLELYHGTQALIDEFIQKSGGTVQNEVQACFNALYAMMLLKLKNVEISPVTQATMVQFGQMIGHLAARYIQFENDDFEF